MSWIIVPGWCPEQGLLLGAVVKAMDKGKVELLVFTCPSMVGLRGKISGKFMLVSRKKGI